MKGRSLAGEPWAFIGMMSHAKAENLWLSHEECGTICLHILGSVSSFSDAIGPSGNSEVIHKHDYFIFAFCFVLGSLNRSEFARFSASIYCEARAAMTDKPFILDFHKGPLFYKALSFPGRTNGAVSLSS
jgi:hypothetical protein